MGVSDIKCTPFPRNTLPLDVFKSLNVVHGPLISLWTLEQTHYTVSLSGSYRHTQTGMIAKGAFFRTLPHLDCIHNTRACFYNLLVPHPSSFNATPAKERHLAKWARAKWLHAKLASQTVQRSSKHEVVRSEGEKQRGVSQLHGQIVTWIKMDWAFTVVKGACKTRTEALIKERLGYGAWRACLWLQDGVFV